MENSKNKYDVPTIKNAYKQWMSLSYTERINFLKEAYQKAQNDDVVVYFSYNSFKISHLHNRRGDIYNFNKSGIIPILFIPKDIMNKDIYNSLEKRLYLLGQYIEYSLLKRIKELQKITNGNKLQR